MTRVFVPNLAVHRSRQRPTLTTSPFTAVGLTKLAQQKCSQEVVVSKSLTGNTSRRLLKAPLKRPRDPSGGFKLSLGLPSLQEKIERVCQLVEMGWRADYQSVPFPL